MSNTYTQRSSPASPKDINNFDHFSKTQETLGTPGSSSSPSSESDKALREDKDAVLTGVGFNYTSDSDAVKTKQDAMVSWVVSSAGVLGGLEKDARIRSIRVEGMDLVDLRHEHFNVMQRFGKIGCNQVCYVWAVSSYMTCK
jgi:hypothetical protein